VLDGVTLQHLFATDTSDVDNDDLSSVAWSEDGYSLYAAGQWQVAGQYCLRHWPEGGEGKPANLPICRDIIMALRPLPEGRMAFAVRGPCIGLFGAEGYLVWKLSPLPIDFRD
jgi:hypothetical protein